MKGLKLYMILSGLGLMVYLVAQYYKPVPTNWTPTYLKEDKIPFGLYILHQQIKDVLPGAQIETTRMPVYNTLHERTFVNTSYLFVASSVDIDKTDYAELKHFMERGNHVFIAAFNLGKFLQDTLNLELRTHFNLSNKKSVPVDFTNPALRDEYPYTFDKGLGDQYFGEIDSARATVLGKNESGEANFVKYNFGKGALFILPNPQLLCNYSLLNPLGAEYAAKALSYLPVSKTLIWDEHNTIGDADKQSPLSVIFKYDAFRWAYYLALAGLVLFVLFEMKRRQRIIPVVEPLKNSSVEFAEVVGRVYYEQRNNTDITVKKIGYLLEYIRTRYRLKTTLLDKELEDALIVRSGVQEETIRGLFNTIRNIQNSSAVRDNQLIQLNKLMEQFYQQAQ